MSQQNVGYILNAQEEWVDYIKENRVGKNVIYSRSHKAPLKKLNKGDLVFCIKKGTRPRAIHLWGTFQGYETIGIKEAWKKYKNQIAANSLKDWNNDLKKTGDFWKSGKLLAVKLARIQEALLPINVDKVLPNLTKYLQKGQYLSVEEISLILNYVKASSSNLFLVPEIDEQEDKGYDENKRKLIKHISRERNSEVVKNAKKKWKNQNALLPCEVCENSFKEIYGSDYIEAHHRIPLAEYKEGQKTHIRDLAPVCPNCHRALHLTNKSIPVLKNLMKQTKNV